MQSVNIFNLVKKLNLYLSKMRKLVKSHMHERPTYETLVKATILERKYSATRQVGQRLKAIATAYKV